MLADRPPFRAHRSCWLRSAGDSYDKIVVVSLTWSMLRYTTWLAVGLSSIARISRRTRVLCLVGNAQLGGHGVRYFWVSYQFVYAARRKQVLR